MSLSLLGSRVRLLTNLEVTTNEHHEAIGWAAAAAALALSAAFVGAGAANAVDALDVKPDKAMYKPGDTAKVTVAGCQDSDILNVVVTVGDREMKMMDTTNSMSVAIPGLLGTYTVKAQCVSYDTDKVLAEGNTTFKVEYNDVIVEPNRWKAGDEIALTAFGYKPGEKVTLTMVHKVSGKLVWTKAVGTADKDGILKVKVVLKSDVKLGSYLLHLTGDESGRKAWTEFYWGQPDKDKGKPGKPGSGTSKPGIPKTGN